MTLEETGQLDISGQNGRVRNLAAGGGSVWVIATELMQESDDDPLQVLGVNLLRFDAENLEPIGSLDLLAELDIGPEDMFFEGYNVTTSVFDTDRLFLAGSFNGAPTLVIVQP